MGSWAGSLKARSAPNLCSSPEFEFSAGDDRIVTTTNFFKSVCSERILFQTFRCCCCCCCCCCGFVPIHGTKSVSTSSGRRLMIIDSSVKIHGQTKNLDLYSFMKPPDVDT